MKREDVRPEGCAPIEVQRFLSRIGGKNPFKEPIYRMVLAQHVMVLEGGEWHDYPDNAEIHERGGVDYELGKSGLYLAGENAARPERVVIEMRWQERYQDTGWMMQRWYPSDNYSREVWEKMTLKSHPGIQCLGPFPVYGNYEECIVWQEELGSGLMLVNPVHTPYGMCSKFLKEIPPMRVLEKAVVSFENRPLPTDLAATAEQRMKIKFDEYIRHETKRREDRKQRNTQIMHEHMKPYWGNSLESARLREQLAKKAGIRTHVGA